MHGLELRDNGGRRLGGRPVVGTAPTDGQVLTWVNANSRWEPSSSSVAAPASDVNGFRLTLTSNTPVTTNDVTGATTIYLSPFVNNAIGLYDGTNWITRTSAEVSLALGTLTSGLPYDVFAYWTGSAVALEILAWTNGTTRATALVRQAGVWTKLGDATRRYVGTFYTTSATTTEDSAAQRLLFNAANRVRRSLRAKPSDTTWSYTLTTPRPWNNTTTAGYSRVNVMIGISEDPVSLRVHMFGYNTVGGVTFLASLGLDSTSAIVANCIRGGADNLVEFQALPCFYDDYPGVGFHFFQGLEQSTAIGTTNWYGDANTYETGMVGVVLA